MKTGIELITEERQRQIKEEKWTSEHDAEFTDGQLADAAACYCIDTNRHINWNSFKVNAKAHIEIERNLLWPWDIEWWKPTPENRIRELQKAGALIAAEIDRINNKSKKGLN